MSFTSYDRGLWGVSYTHSDPKAQHKHTFRSDTKNDPLRSYQLMERDSDQQRNNNNLPLLNIKPAVIISGRRPQGGITHSHHAHAQTSHRDNTRTTVNDSVHYVLPVAAPSKISTKQTDRERTLEKMRIAREMRVKEEQARKAAAEEAKRTAAEEARKAAVDEARRAAAQHAELAKRSVRWPLTPEEVRIHFKRELTDFELNEVQKYKEIWYLGLGKQRKNRSSRSKKDDHDDGMYAAEAHDHVAYRYEIIGMLGRGSFGQVFKCRDHKNQSDVAIKMLRNKKKFYRQGIVEVRLLEHLRNKDGTNNRNVIHMLDCFHFRKHICIVLELAGINLYDLLKRNAFNGFSVLAVKRFAWNILQCLQLLQQEQIIHCDIKPENILLRSRQGTPGASIYDIKVTDFGSGCFVQEQIYCYIQSRYYRAPEIILGFAYDCGIDIWSFACVLAELMLGRPLFPGENEADQLSCIMEVLGLPPRRILTAAPRARYFFDSAGNPTRTTNSRGKKRIPGTRPLQSILKTSDRRFLDFMRRCLEWDPRLRITADQLLTHEWMLGQPGTRSGGGGGAREYPSFTSHSRHASVDKVSFTDYDNRDVVAELLSTNPFNEDSDYRTGRTITTDSQVEDEDD